MGNLPSKPKSLGLFLIVIFLIYSWQDVIPNKAFSQTGLFVREMTNVDEVFSKFMDDWNIPGGSIAIVKDGRLVYARGFGYADKESNERVTPDHLFRIASIAKPITSIAIMKLINEGLINVDTKVFGYDGILNGPDYRTIIDARVTDITVQHLLQHTSGWGFINGNQDPMFSNEHIAQRMSMNPPVGPVTVIKFMLRTQRLHNEPGVNYSYSNFGYCILGRIIEQVSGKSYENYVKTELLNPLGISEMQLAQNLYENKASNEVRYYDFLGAPLVNSVYRRGERVPFPYGGFNIEAMDSHGGWIASATDLVRLLVAVDGFDTKPDILNQASIQLMTTPSDANDYYSMGWAVNPWGNWWHIGDLPGTSSILVRTHHGLGWAVLFNTRPSNLQNFLGRMDNMVWQAIDKINNWPTHDLFEQTIAEIEEAYANEMEEAPTTEIEEASTVKTVEMPDQNLAATVRKALRLGSKAPFTEQNMRRLTRLTANNSEITNLTGLEYATQLETLNLGGNAIRDLHPLAELTQLERLILWNNEIKDISPIAGLTQLEWLNLKGNQISNVSPLASLKQLKRLYLHQNDIHDVSPLAKLINLEEIRLRGNPIQDTSPLARLPKETKMDIKISREPVVHVGAAQRPPMYWINAETGTLHRLVGNEVENFIPQVKNVTSLAVDATNNKIYWTEQRGKNKGSIKSAYLDGSNVLTLATLNSIPRSIAVDTMRGMLYWTDARDRIQQTNLNGSRIKNLIRNLDSPENITVDVAGGKLYWTEASGNIRSADLNGKSIENIASGLGRLSGIAISGNKIYYGTTITGESSGSIGRVNLNGSNLRTLVRLQSVPSNIVIDAEGRKLYWTDSSGNILRSNLVGRFIKNVVSNLQAPADFALGNLDIPTAAAPVNTSLASSGISTPDATDLLSNYPNPFNPETWIPYRLSKSVDVQITIYNMHGTVIRHLDLGHQSAGVYESRSRAVYWDGKNALGEPVASGVYFYTLTAGDFTATRKMLIRK